jgi:hypothetical protein
MILLQTRSALHPDEGGTFPWTAIESARARLRSPATRDLELVSSKPRVTALEADARPCFPAVSLVRGNGARGKRSASARLFSGVFSCR